MVEAFDPITIIEEQPSFTETDLEKVNKIIERAKENLIKQGLGKINRLTIPKDDLALDLETEIPEAETVGEKINISKAAKEDVRLRLAGELWEEVELKEEKDALEIILVAP